MRRTIILALAVCLTFGVTFATMAQPRGGGRGQGPGGPGMSPMPDLVEKLKLNDAQQKAWEAIRSELDESTKAHRTKIGELRDQGSTRDSEEFQEIRTEMQKAFAKAESDLMDVLDDEQKSEYRTLKKEAKKERGRRGRGMGRGGGKRGGGF